jgi:hypothetical protein
MIRAIRAVVHENYSPKQAHELFREVKEKENKKLASV